MTTRSLLVVVGATLFLACTTTNFSSVSALAPNSSISRRQAVTSAAAAALGLNTAILSTEKKIAAAATPKLQNMSNDDLAAILTKDVQVNQFMVSADITREAYDESATFTDEIDTYGMDQWIKGTKRLFVANKSHVDLVPNTMQVTETEASFLFTETLLFNIPIIQPKVYLSGKVVFTRDPATGLITSYKEKWDQDVNQVLREANYFSS